MFLKGALYTISREHTEIEHASETTRNIQPPRYTLCILSLLTWHNLRLTWKCFFLHKTLIEKAVIIPHAFPRCMSRGASGKPWCPWCYGPIKEASVWKQIWVALYNLLVSYREPFCCGKCSPAPTQKGQWGARSGTQAPHSWIGFPVGNQACIVPRLLWGLLLLKLPHPGLRQQMFTEYL